MGMTIDEHIAQLKKLKSFHNGSYGASINFAIDIMRKYQKIQEPQSFKWCTDCQEYDQEKHCCHRWSKVIRDTVAEIRQEPVLDKLRAEIELKEKTLTDKYGQQKYGIWTDDVLQIIDEYKAETENP